MHGCQDTHELLMSTTHRHKGCVVSESHESLVNMLDFNILFSTLTARLSKCASD